MDTRRTFRRAEVQDVAVFAEHVDLLYARNRLDVELLERALQLFVVLRGRRLGLPHNLAAHGPLTACTDFSALAIVDLDRPFCPRISSPAPLPHFHIARHRCSTARGGKTSRPAMRKRRTDPVRRCLRLQLGQFCGVHGDDSRGSGSSSSAGAGLAVAGSTKRLRFVPKHDHTSPQSTTRERASILFCCPTQPSQSSTVSSATARPSLDQPGAF